MNSGPLGANPYQSPAPVADGQRHLEIPPATGCLVCDQHDRLQRTWLRVNAGNYYVFYATNDNFFVHGNCCDKCRAGLSRAQTIRYAGLAVGMAAIAIMYFMPLGSSLLGVPRIIWAAFGLAMMIIAGVGPNIASRRRLTREAARRFKSCSKRQLPVRHLAIVNQPKRKVPQYTL